MAADTKKVADPSAVADPLAVAGYSEGVVARPATAQPATAQPGGLQHGTTLAASSTMLADSEVIPVLRETVRITKREVETGRIIVHKTVTERDEAVEMLLKRTDISVERIPVNQVVTEAPGSRQDGDTLIIPILEEVLVVEKRLVLKEELHIRKDNSERTVHETVRLRSEEVRIEQTHGDQASTDQAHTDQAGVTTPATHPEI
jgi:uncharacterized protein (TIGR02271 family)